MLKTHFFLKRKGKLENSIGKTVFKTRQHWLNIYESKTLKIHSDFESKDYTIGWNDISGYRAGCASKFHPYDHKNKKAYNHIVIPQLIMDSHIFDYRNNIMK